MRFDRQVAAPQGEAVVVVGHQDLDREEVAVHQRQGRVAEEERQDPDPVAPQAPREERQARLARQAQREELQAQLARPVQY